MKYLGVRQVLRIHERVIETSGGDPTILDLARIDAAVAQPRMTFGGASLYPTLAAKAAAPAFALVKGHPFLDGNKRTGQAAKRMFLRRNRHEIAASADEREAVFVGLAAGAIDRDQFVRRVADHIVRKPR